MCQPSQESLLPIDDKQVQTFGAKMLLFKNDTWISVEVSTNKKCDMS